MNQHPHVRTKYEVLMSYFDDISDNDTILKLVGGLVVTQHLFDYVTHCVSVQKSTCSARKCVLYIQQQNLIITIEVNKSHSFSPAYRYVVFN